MRTIIIKGRTSSKLKLVSQFLIGLLVTYSFLVFLDVNAQIKGLKGTNTKIKSIEPVKSTKIISEIIDKPANRYIDWEIREVRVRVGGVKVEKAKGIRSKWNTEKARVFIGSYASDSPMLPYIKRFEDYDEKKAKIALAIAGHETLFGTSPNYYNAWGYGCNNGYPGGRFDCGWRDWSYAIKRYMEVADNYLSLYDGSKKSIRSIANEGYYQVGADGSSQKDQDKWVNSLRWFAGQF